MCHDIRSFDSHSIIPVNYVIRLGDKTTVNINRAGTAFVNDIPLFCLFVPQFRLSLISVSQLDTQGYKSVFFNGTCTITNPVGHTFLKAKKDDGGLYIPYSNADANISTRSGLETRPPEPARTPSKPVAGSTEIEPQIPSKDDKTKAKPVAEPATDPAAPTKLSKQSDSIQLWHRRLAHLNPVALKQLLSSTMPSTIQFPTSYWHDSSKCETCIIGKHTQKFERTKQRRATRPFEFIHSDLCGPMKSSIGGASYYIIYIDDFTRYTEGMTISLYHSIPFYTTLYHSIPFFTGNEYRNDDVVCPIMRYAWAMPDGDRGYRKDTSYIDAR
jgi:hypothetical protein